MISPAVASPAVAGPADHPLRPVMIVPDFDRIGGYERQAFFLTRHCVASGIDSFILTNNPWDSPPREVRDGVVIHRLEPLPRSRTNWANLFKSFLLFLDSHRDDYDVIHCHAFTFLSACCVLIGKLLKKPVLIKVATEQDIREFHFGKKLGFRIFYPLIRRADRFLSLSECIQREFLSCGFRKKRVVVQPNGVECAHFSVPTSEQRLAHKKSLALDDGRFHFIYSGRLVRRKGVDVLLKAFHLSPRLRETRLLILGDGEERAELESQARELGLVDRVRFLGEHEEVRPYLCASDAFVFPSRREGLPNALLEAMSTGLPAIATRIGGCTDVITDGSGLLVEPDDPRELSRQMERVAGDSVLRGELAERSRQRILERFSFEIVAKDLQEIYRSALRDKGA